jgi:glycosyltransferase involved in cell wall biosynthesis
MKVVFCWSAISGYMAACWRNLSQRAGIDLHVVAHGSPSSAGCHNELLAGLSHTLLDERTRHDERAVEGLVAGHKPDIVVTTGWWLPAYRKLVHSPRLAPAKFVMGVDSPWRHEGQFLTRLRYGRSLRKFHHFFVTGERSWQYVTRLGVPPDRISRGMYGVDTAAWNQVATSRQRTPWPRRFVFLGRYDAVKSIDVLVAGYRAYRTLVSDPWPLVCCGTGPERHRFTGAPGIIDNGFVQPGELPRVLAQSGVFVLPSRFDPWPLALVEAAAAGLPVVCTDACGSAVEVVRPFYNGLVIPSGSSAALASALVAVHDRGDALAEWGFRSVELAAPYASEFWADRWQDACARLMAG